jgi:protein involved in temperature-dependent protein secretion
MPKRYTRKMMKKNSLGNKKRKHVRSGTKKNGKKGQKWVTAFSAANKTLRETKSLEKAQTKLREQALINAQKLFGQTNESQFRS